LNGSRNRMRWPRSRIFQDRADMGFIVESVSKPAGEPPYRISKATLGNAKMRNA
jgi:hypothetical protein